MSCEKIVQDFFDNTTLEEVASTLLLVSNTLNNNPPVQQIAEHERRAISHDLSELLTFFIRLNAYRVGGANTP